jgi:hypothetical protein
MWATSPATTHPSNSLIILSEPQPARTRRYLFNYPLRSKINILATFPERVQMSKIQFEHRARNLHSWCHRMKYQSVTRTAISGFHLGSAEKHICQHSSLI